MTETMTCIVCPLGCQISVNGGKAQGYGCYRGKKWALQEAALPLRTLTTTVFLEGGELLLLPVRTRDPVPRDKLGACLSKTNRLRVKAPVQVGQVICEDLAETGASLIATRTVGKRMGD